MSGAAADAPDGPGGPPPHLSLVIPAYNEEAFLPRLLDTVDAARAAYRGPDGRGAIEVIVADNSSTDRTAEVAAARGCRVASVELRRIAAARNGGAKIARGEILCFVDADYRIHPETFNVIDREMSTGRFVGGGTGMVLERRSLGIMIVVAAILPAVRVMGFEAGVWFCRRDDFHAVGGYDETQMISEDVRFLWALKQLGRRRRPRQKMSRGRFDGPPAPAVLSLRKYDKRGDWHGVRDMFLVPFRAIFARHKYHRWVQSYWYEDR